MLTWSQARGDSSKNCGLFCRKFRDDVESLDRYNVEICPKIHVDRLAVQALPKARRVERGRTRSLRPRRWTVTVWTVERRQPVSLKQSSHQELLRRKASSQRITRGTREQPSGEKSGDEVASLFMGSVDRREKCNRRRVLIEARSATDVTGKPGNGSRDRLNCGNPTKLETWV